MTLTIPSSVFHAAMKQRKANHPFNRISSHKVRESRHNLHHEANVVGSIAEYLRAPRGSYGRPSMLVSCTEEDKGYRLKRVPEIVAHELGYNLIPALRALGVEGPRSRHHRLSPVDQTAGGSDPHPDCDAIQMATARSIKSEYAALKAELPPLEAVCADALDVAEQAAAFCKEHGVL